MFILSDILGLRKYEAKGDELILIGGRRKYCRPKKNRSHCVVNESGYSCDFSVKILSLLAGRVTAGGVAFCPIAGLVKSVVLAIAALFTPDVVVALGNNYVLVDRERDDDIVFFDGVHGGCGLVELGTPFAVASADILGTVNQGVQCCLGFNCENVLSHWVSLVRFLRVTGYNKKHT